MNKGKKKDIKEKKKLSNKIVKDKKKLKKINKKIKKKEKGSLIERIFKVNNKFNFIGLIKNILLPLGGGILISFLTKSNINMYNNFKKPIFAPPSFVFPIVWTIIYILIGIAAYRIYMNNKNGKDDKGAYFYYLIQLSVNFLWSIIFFNLRLYGISFLLTLMLLILIIITTIKFFKADKIAGGLMVPYILWVSFASVLTFFIWMLNEM